MTIIPDKQSKKWIWVSIVLAVLIFSVILISRVLLNAQMDLRAYGSLGLVSVLFATLACIGGWLGGKLYFLCSAAGLLFGSIYMLYISIANASPGWNDLVGIISFLFLALAGIGIGLLAELIRYILQKRV